MSYTLTPADPDEQKIWDDFCANGTVTTEEGYVIVGLTFWREPDNEHFMAGYLLDCGGICEEYNIPDPILESICPGRNIWWNSSSQSHTAMGVGGRMFKSTATEKDLAEIEAVFLAYGFQDDTQSM